MVLGELDDVNVNKLADGVRRWSLSTASTASPGSTGDAVLELLTTMLIVTSFSPVSKVSAAAEIKRA